jgi:hypothetical protein
VVSQVPVLPVPSAILNPMLVSIRESTNHQRNFFCNIICVLDNKIDFLKIDIYNGNSFAI